MLDWDKITNKRLLPCEEVSLRDNSAILPFYYLQMKKKSLKIACGGNLISALCKFETCLLKSETRTMSHFCTMLLEVNNSPTMGSMFWGSILFK